MGLENVVKNAMEYARDNTFKLACKAMKFADYYVKNGNLNAAWWYAT